MATYKKGTSLYETTPTLDDMATEAGLEQAPTSATGAAAIGATPKQQDMAGTKLAKQSVIKRKQEAETRQQFERRAPSKATATQQERERIEKATRLKEFGSLSQRIPNILESRAKAKITADETIAQEAATGGDTSLLDHFGYTADQASKDPSFATANQSLGKFLAGGATTDLLNDLLELEKPDGTALFSTTDVAGLISNSKAQLAKASATALGETPTLSEFTDDDWATTNFGSKDEKGKYIVGSGQTEAAELLGISVEDLGNIDIDDLDDAVEAVQLSQFSEIAGLNARISALPKGSHARNALIAERSRLGGVGIDVAEQEIEDIAEEIDLGTKLTFGDNEYSIEDLLGNDKISEVIEDWLLEDEEGRADLLEDYPEFSTWLTKNESALSALTTDVEEAVKDQETIQTEYTDLSTFADGSSMSDDLKDFLDLPADATVTQAELAAATAKLEATDFYTFQQDKDTDAGLLAEVNSLSKDQLTELFTDRTPEQIQNAWAAKKERDAYPADFWDFVGIAKNDSLLGNLDSAYNSQATEYKSNYDKMAKRGLTATDHVLSDLVGGLFSDKSAEGKAKLAKFFKDTTATTISNINNALKLDPELLEDFEAMPNQLGFFANSEDRLKQAGNRADAKKAVDNKDTKPETLFAEVYGPNDSMTNLISHYETVKKFATAGDPQSQGILAQLDAEFGANFFATKGQDTTALRSKLDDALKTHEDIGATGGAWSVAGDNTLLETTRLPYQPQDESVRKYLEDGILSDDEISSAFNSVDPNAWDEAVRVAEMSGVGHVLQAHAAEQLQESMVTTTQGIAEIGTDRYSEWTGTHGAARTLVKTDNPALAIQNIMVHGGAVEGLWDSWDEDRAKLEDMNKLERDAYMQDVQHIRDRVNVAIEKLNTDLASPGPRGAAATNQLQEYIARLTSASGTLTHIGSEIMGLKNQMTIQEESQAKLDKATAKRGEYESSDITFGG